MATIRAPFNFVPLSKTVYFPNWADKISHDIPFSDGISGTIELKITAKSPIFVRNGHTRKDAEDKNNNYKSFSKTSDNKYFIPGTSIKGAIRSVMEIMSFGKIGQVQNQSFGIRDLSEVTTDGRFYKEKIKAKNVNCGWLYISNNKYYIKDCGIPWRISIEELDNKFGCGLEDFVKNSNFKDEENRYAKKKYDLLKKINLQNKFTPDEDLRQSLKGGNRLFVKFSDDGDTGTIVFTGQPGERKKGNKTNKKGEKIWKGKFFEFVFSNEVKRTIEVDKYTIDDFISIHKNSPDYKEFRKKELEDETPIPVFFIYNETDKNEQKIDSIGLSYMYKYPAYNSIYNAIPENLLSDQQDMADCIFGSIKNNKLKGRVIFASAFAEGTPVECKEKNIVLSSPNPSYYPLYLGDGQTWNSERVEIAGRKRYPTRSLITNSTLGTENMQNLIVPLSEGTVFTEKIKFHNLRKVELATLLASISFNNHKECYHNIGSGKSLGYGKVLIEILNIKTHEQSSLTDYLTIYDNLIKEIINPIDYDSIMNELFAMAKGIPQGRENEFTYMHMDINRKNNEFINGKNEYSDGKQLGKFLQIINNNVPKAKFIGNVKSSTQRENIEKIKALKLERDNQLKDKIELAKIELEKDNLEKSKKMFLEIEESLIDKRVIYEYLKIIEQRLNSKTLEFNRIKEEADNLFINGKFKEAKEKYLEAKSLNVEVVDTYLLKCEDEITKIEKINNCNIEDAITISSIGALAGSLKNWIKVKGELNESQYCEIANKIRINISDNKRKQQEWLNFKKWGKIIHIINEKDAKQLYDKIK